VLDAALLSENAFGMSLKRRKLLGNDDEIVLQETRFVGPLGQRSRESSPGGGSWRIEGGLGP